MVGGPAPKSANAPTTAGSAATRNVLDAVLGPGVVSWDPVTGDDPTGAPPMLGQGAQALDSEHMQAYGISQVRRGATLWLQGGHGVAASP